MKFFIVFLAFVAFCNADPCSDSLAINNNYRAQHGAFWLNCSGTISSVAQEYANKLAVNCDFKHSGDSRYGENLYMMGTTGTLPSAGEAAKNAVNSWYSEETCYDYNNPTFNSCRAECKTETGCKTAVGHFTQVVWKGTSEVGVGVSTCTKNGFKYLIVVANYKNPGNYMGQFAANVGRKV